MCRLSLKRKGDNPRVLGKKNWLLDQHTCYFWKPWLRCPQWNNHECLSLVFLDLLEYSWDDAKWREDIYILPLCFIIKYSRRQICLHIVYPWNMSRCEPYTLINAPHPDISSNGINEENEYHPSSQDRKRL